MASGKNTGKNKSVNGSAREQLKAILPSLSMKTPYNGTLPINAGQWKTEGYDHINISRFSSESLGRQLDFDYIRVFDHPKLGTFKSMNSLWHFIRARHPNDQIRMTVGGALRMFVQRECGGFIPVPNFRALMMHSAYLRVKGDQGLSKAIVKSTLPFDCYRTIQDSGIRMRFEHAAWFVGGYEEIRAALKEQREPNFEPLMDKKVDDLYAELIGRLAPDPDPNPDTAPVRKVDSKEQSALTGKRSYDIVDIDSAVGFSAEGRPLSPAEVAALAEKEFANEYESLDESSPAANTNAEATLAEQVVELSNPAVDDAIQAAEAVIALPVEDSPEVVMSTFVRPENVVTPEIVEKAHLLVAEAISEEAAENTTEASPVVLVDTAVGESESVVQETVVVADEVIEVQKEPLVEETALKTADDSEFDTDASFQAASMPA